MPTTDEVVERYSLRRRHHQARIAKMNEVKDAYNGDLTIPLPELNTNERPMVANLIAQGVDQTAMRIVSTMPNVTCPPLRAGFEGHEDNADDRRKVIMGWWDMNRLELLQSQRARWLLTYASAPVMIRPDPRRKIPMWQARNPMNALPPPGDDLTPVDMIFTYRKTLSWLRKIYPDTVSRLDVGRDPSPDQQFTLIDYCDSDYVCTIVMGATPSQDMGGPMLNAPFTTTPGQASKRGLPWVEVERMPNRAGICPAVIPSRIGLDGPVGQFDGLVGLFWNQAMLMALEVIAVKRAIFEDEWIIGRPNETPQVLVPADGLAGIRGELSGAVIQKLGSTPGVMTYQTLDRIERAMRLSGGIPAEMTGESPTNVRTARRGAQVLSSTIDFAIAEAQKIFEASLEEENARAIAIDKAYFSGEKSFYFSWNGMKGRGKYDPRKLWVSDENEVRYSFPGADINELVVGIGQRLGMEVMSHYRAMELDPLQDDPELERARIAAEGLQRAFVQGLQQQMSTGAIPPDDAAYIVSQILTGKVDNEAEAVMAAQKRAQARQASQPSAGPAETPAALPPGSPEAQPGLAQPGMGAEAAAIAAPAPSMDNLAQLMSTMRRTGG